MVSTFYISFSINNASRHGPNDYVVADASFLFGEKKKIKSKSLTDKCKKFSEMIWTNPIYQI